MAGQDFHWFTIHPKIVMATVRLEFDSLVIHRPKQRWNLYFVLATEHPTDSDKMVLTVTPEPFIRLKPPAKNRVDFVPDGNGTDGLNMLEREIPEDHSIRVRVYLRHSHQPARNMGEVLGEIKEELGDKVIDTVLGLFGATQPWLILTKATFDLIVTILRNVKDRDMGFLSLDEHFTREFQENGEQDRSATTSTGEATLTWTWSLE